MRFKFDHKKSEQLQNNTHRGIGFEDAQEIFSHPYYEDCRSDDPKQFRAIGWVSGRLYSLVFEVREDDNGEYYHLVTLWKSTREEQKSMKKTADKLSAEDIAVMADRREDVSKHFTNKGTMKKPVQRVNVDFTTDMLYELDQLAAEMNISRQAVIKSYLRQAMDQHRMAKSKAG